MLYLGLRPLIDISDSLRNKLVHFAQDKTIPDGISPDSATVIVASVAASGREQSDNADSDVIFDYLLPQLKKKTEYFCS